MLGRRLVVVVRLVSNTLSVDNAGPKTKTQVSKNN